jgi:hypothetical protein
MIVRRVLGVCSFGFCEIGDVESGKLAQCLHQHRHHARIPLALRGLLFLLPEPGFDVPDLP